MNARNQRFPLFDSLRAIAALSVFAYHIAFHTGGLSGGLGPWLAHLNVGVPVFFLVSGFLLYRPWSQTRWEGAAVPSVRRYAVRRTLRIVPAYWLALPLVALWLGLDDVFTPVGALVHFGFLQAYVPGRVIGGIGQAWTLSVEMSFYVALPLLALAVRCVPARTPRAFLATELALCLLLALFAVLWQRQALDHLGPGNAILFPALIGLPAALDLFALGMALAAVSVWLQGTGAQPLPVRVIARAGWVPWLGAGLAYWALVNVSVWFGGGQTRQVLATHELGGLVALGLLLPAVFGQERRDVVRRLLGSRPLLWVGRVSYAFYLWHLAVILELQEYGLRNALGRGLFTVACLAVSLTIAALSWYGIERRFVALAPRPPPRRSQDDAAADPERLVPPAPPPVTERPE